MKTIYLKRLPQPNLVLILCIYLFSFWLHAETIEVSHIHWPPFEDQKNPDKPGISIEILDKLLARIGYTTINYHKVPWSRAIAQLEWGKTHLIPSIWYRDERTTFAYYSYPYTVNQIKLFSLAKNNITIKTQADLKNFFISVFRNTAMVPDMKKWAKQVTQTEDTTGGIRLLLGNRVDAVIEDQTAFEYQAQNLLNLETIAISEYTYKAEGLQAAFSRKLPNVEQKTLLFNAELNNMLQSGEIKNIFNKYGITWIEPTATHIEMIENQPPITQ